MTRRTRGQTPVAVASDAIGFLHHASKKKPAGSDETGGLSWEEWTSHTAGGKIERQFRVRRNEGELPTSPSNASCRRAGAALQLRHRAFSAPPFASPKRQRLGLMPFKARRRNRNVPGQRAVLEHGARSTRHKNARHSCARVYGNRLVDNSASRRP